MNYIDYYNHPRKGSECGRLMTKQQKFTKILKDLVHYREVEKKYIEDDIIIKVIEYYFRLFVQVDLIFSIV